MPGYGTDKERSRLTGVDRRMLSSFRDGELRMRTFESWHPVGAGSFYARLMKDSRAVRYIF